MATISPEAISLADAAVEVGLEPAGQRIRTRVRTEINDPSVQLLLAEIAVRLERIEKAVIDANPKG